MSVAALVPEVGPIFGLADTTFNFATALTADNSGNPAISLGTTVGKVESDAIRQFQNQGAVIGTQFDLIYQDWGKIQALGKTLGQAQVGSPWYWDGVKTTSMMLAGMTPAITQGFYQSIMAGAYAIGSYLPQCPGDVAWNRCPDSFPAVPQFNQPITYISHNTRSQFQSSSGLVSPFSTLNCCYYSPYTYPTD